MIELILVSWSLVILFMFIAWAWYLHSNNPSIIDACWPICIFLSGTIFIFLQNRFSLMNGRTLLFLFCLAIWMMRLSSFIWLTRLRKNKIDQRYIDLSKNWKWQKSIAFLAHYQFQGILAIIISLPFLFIGQPTVHNLSRLDYIILNFIIVFIICESIADYQLYNFKNEHPGKVCDKGFWRYSRHPNYFFEWLIWLGFAIGAVDGCFSFLAFISPIVLLYIFVYITGPITEKGSIKARGAQYLTYQQKTSMIIPWFPKPHK